MQRMSQRFYFPLKCILVPGALEYMYSLYNAEGSLMSARAYARVCMCVKIPSLKPLGHLKPNIIRNRHGIGENSLFKWPMSFFCGERGPRAGAFSSDFSINLSPQCRMFSRTL